MKRSPIPLVGIPSLARAVSLSMALTLVFSTACGSSGAKKTLPEKKDESAKKAGDEGENAAKKDGDASAGKRAHDPVSCAGTEDIELRNVRIDAPGVAIRSSESCDITIEDSEIVAGDVAVVISGSGDVTIKRSTVRGRSSAFVITGSGDLSARKTHFYGGRAITGSGKFHDRGENSWE